MLKVAPAELKPIKLLERGALQRIEAKVMTAGLPEHIALRELTTVADHYKLRREQLVHEDLGPRAGTGNVLAVAAHFENGGEWVTQYGQRGVTAEKVAARACAELDQYFAHKAAVGEHLADQLLLPMVLAGSGEFTTGVVSEHLRTNADVVEAFGVASVAIEPAPEVKGSRVVVKRAD